MLDFNSEMALYDNMQSVDRKRQREGIRERERDKRFSSAILKGFFLLLLNPYMHRHFVTIHENHPFMT